MIKRKLLRTATGFMAVVAVTSAMSMGVAQTKAYAADNGNAYSVDSQTVYSTTGTTVYNGVDYSAVYNCEYYYNNNADVAAAFGSNTAAYYTHFIDYGEAEGRQASASFDVNYYKSNNADLVSAFGNNLKAYYEHYIQYGQSEGRLGSGSDTNSNTASGTGSNTGSDSSTGSDTNTNTGSDTSTGSNDNNSSNDSTETTSVTVYNGVDYAPVYDYSYYITNNSDLAGMSQEDALAHFVNYGIEEGRQASEDFSVRIYRFENDDVRAVYGDNLAGYVSHYLTNGVNENRNATVIDKDIHFTVADKSTTNWLDNVSDYYYENFFSKTDKITKLMTNKEIFKQIAYYDYAAKLAYNNKYDILGLGNEIEGLVYSAGMRWSPSQPFFGLYSSMTAVGISCDYGRGGFGDSEHRVSLDYFVVTIDGTDYYTLDYDGLDWENDGTEYNLQWNTFLCWTKDEIDNWFNTH